MSHPRVHTQASNRAQKKKKRERPHESDESRKVVFKSTLDNPLVVKPDIPLNVQNALLAALTRILENSGIGRFHEARERLSRRNKEKRKRFKTSNLSTPNTVQTFVNGGVKRKAPEDDTPEMSKKRKIDKSTSAPVSVTLDKTPTVSVNVVERGLPAPPEMLSKITFGVNEVTKRLEAQAADYRQPTPRTNGTPETPKASIRFIFACTEDVDPPSTIEHLPLLVASCNASRPQSRPECDMFLVPLPKNAEGNLTEAVGLRRAAVLALDADTPGLDGIEQFATSLPILTAPWLVPPASRSGIVPPLIPTHIKQLRTTAPKDLRKAKEQRAQGRTMAKSRT